MFHSVAPVSAEEIKAQAVFSGINFTLQTSLEAGPLGRIYNTFEDRELNPLSEALTQLGYTTKPASASRSLGVNVVADHHQHKSPPKKSRIIVQIAAQASSEQESLDVGCKPQGYAFTQERVLNLLLFALLPCE